MLRFFQPNRAVVIHSVKNNNNNNIRDSLQSYIVSATAAVVASAAAIICTNNVNYNCSNNKSTSSNLNVESKNNCLSSADYKEGLSYPTIYKNVLQSFQNSIYYNLSIKDSYVQCESSSNKNKKNKNNETFTKVEERMNNEDNIDITFRQRRLTMNTTNEEREQEQPYKGDNDKNKLNVKNKNVHSNNTNKHPRILYSKEFNQGENTNPTSSNERFANDIDTALPFPSHQVGTYSCHGVEPHPFVIYTESEKPIDQNTLSFFDRMFGTKSAETYTQARVVTISQKKINQDRGHIIYPYGDHDQTALFAVFDGHGECGEMLAEYTMHAVCDKLCSHPNCQNIEEDNDGVEKAFKDIFQEIDKEVLSIEGLKSKHSGSTACVVLLRSNNVWVSNIGDSRAVSARRCKDQDHPKKTSRLEAIDWSKDQNANDESERRRVIQAGGYVTLPHEEGLPARIWLDKDCSQIGLAMSRSIGDHALKNVGVISEPKVNEFKLTDDDEVSEMN